MHRQRPWRPISDRSSPITTSLRTIAVGQLLRVTRRGTPVALSPDGQIRCARSRAETGRTPSAGVRQRTAPSRLGLGMPRQSPRCQHLSRERPTQPTALGVRRSVRGRRPRFFAANSRRTRVARPWWTTHRSNVA